MHRELLRSAVLDLTSIIPATAYHQRNYVERYSRDKITGTKAERPGLETALSHLRDGDTLVVWRLDRLGRSLKHLIETVTALQSTGVAFQSITENINTSTATGQLVFHIFGALAEFERNLIKERTIAGVSAARARGRKGGRPTLNTSSRKVAMAKKLYALPGSNGEIFGAKELYFERPQISLLDSPVCG